MDQEVAKTLGELELKLQQLEHELTSIGPRDAPADRTQESDSASSDSNAPVTGPSAAPGADPSHAPGVASSYAPSVASSHTQPQGRLVDEAMEPSQAAEAIAEGDRFGGPPVFGGEEVPAQPAATGQDWKADVRETAYGEIPSESPPGRPVPDPPGPPIPPSSPTPQPPPTPPPGPPPPEHPPAPTPPSRPQPIDRAELVRFKQRLEQTLAELSEELGRLLLPKPPT